MLRSRWYQFGLRSVLAVMLLVAVAFAAWRVVTGPFRRQRAAMEYIEAAAGNYSTRPGGPAWLRHALDEEQFQEVVVADVSGAACSDVCLRHLLSLRRLEKLAVGGPQFGDDQLRRLRALPQLRLLLLDSTAVSDEELERLRAARPGLAVHRSQRRAIAALREAGATVVVLHRDRPPQMPAAWADEHFRVATIVFYRDQQDAGILAQLRHLADLQTLRVDRSAVTDAHLAHLEHLTHLVWLDLAGTEVGDAGLQRLTGLKELRWLALEDTRVSTECAEQMQRALPRAAVRH